MSTFLENKVHLEPFSACHLEVTRKWMNDPELMRVLNRGDLISEQEHHSWFQTLSTNKHVLYFAIEYGQKRIHVGNVWLVDIDFRHKKAELRIMIGESAQQGKGVGSQAIHLLTKYAFYTQGLHKVYAFVLGFNAKAYRAFQSAGFSIEGTLKKDRFSGGKYVDVWLLGQLADEKKD